MTRKINYDIHNLISIEILTRSKLDLLKDLNFFLSYFETEDIGNPDIELNIGEFSPSNTDCYIVDHKYYIKENYFYCSDQIGNVKFNVEIFGFEKGKSVVNFDGNVHGLEQLLIPDYLAQNMILRPLIELKLLQRGYAVIHGLGLEKNGKSVILAGRGGSHKTSIAMTALRNNYRLIGDDRVILSSDGKVYSYPFYHKLIRFKADCLSEEHVSSIFDKYRMLKYLNSNIEDDTRLKYFSDIGTLSEFILLAKSDSSELVSRDLDVRSTASKLINNSKMEMVSSGISRSLGKINFLKYMCAYSYVFPDSYISNYWLLLSEFLMDALNGTHLTHVRLPMNYDSIIFQRLVEESW